MSFGEGEMIAGGREGIFMLEFHEIDFANIDKYREYVKLCLQVPSDMSPYTVLAYKDTQQIKSAFAYNLFWFKAHINGEEFWLPPIGDWNEIDWSEVFKTIPVGTKFKYVPTLLLNCWENSMPACFTIVDDRDNWDYVWYLERLADAQGKKYKKYRLAYNRFKKEYSYKIDKITPDTFDEIRQFHEQCEADLLGRTDKADDAEEESKAFYQFLNHWNDQYLYGYILRAEDEIACVWIDEIIDEHNVVGLYTKQNYKFEGVTAFSYITEAAIATEKGFSIMNIMSDIGSEGLRYHKENSNPLVMMQKYEVSFNGIV